MNTVSARFSWDLIDTLTISLCTKIVRELRQAGKIRRPRLLVYPVPRGGIPAALHIKANMRFVDGSIGVYITANVNEADIIIDDIIYSGKTKKQFQENYPDKPFYAIVDKPNGVNTYPDSWFEFPWESMTNESGPEENIVRILEYIGENPFREGLKETPSRVVRSFSELYAGYITDPKTIFKTFEDDTSDEMIISKDIPFFSMCEHHMLPFVGHATIAYIPDKKIVGLSKLSRLLECFSRRLQIQERLTSQITTAINEALQPRGSACLITAEHMCMSCRGVNKSGSKMITSSLTGVFRDESTVRQEFLHLAKG